MLDCLKLVQVFWVIFNDRMTTGNKRHDGQEAAEVDNEKRQTPQ